MIFFRISLMSVSIFLTNIIYAQYAPEFSTAGFYEIPNSGRNVFSMNIAWQLHKGALDIEPITTTYDDSHWEVVSIPNGIEYLPEEASGSINYQGEVWYRKHFTPNDSLKNKKTFLHFEAIMGKSKIWLNGKLLKEHFGGFLPIVVDISNEIEFEKDNVITVWADNSNDPSFPPGKPQQTMDFTYFGGIYRDCWLITHNKTFITDENYADIPAGGGLLVAYEEVSDKNATILLKLHTKNEKKQQFKGQISYQIKSSKGKTITTKKMPLIIKSQSENTTEVFISIKKPKLWSPENPQLYHLFVKLIDNKGNVIDGYRKKIGIRSIEFKGSEGLWLNGKPYKEPLIGANRHQDFALIGNALPNSLHWKDAKKLKDVGMTIIRNAHYPQDPAFMDACDELGLFVIVTTPGWHFWSKDPIFEQRVYKDIRNMIRRDRNHPSVFLWEPILNETLYPTYFAKKTVDIVREEFPYKNSHPASDKMVAGSEYFNVQYAHPTMEKLDDPKKTYFTREWGDNVDSWLSHNSTSRVHRSWGEHAMLVQAKHYANPNYLATSLEFLHSTTKQHIGGALWHSFDHQRGYNPDPFYGGIMDAFRQPKYAYYMFMSQRSPVVNKNLIADTGAMIYIANEMTPFSSNDVTIFSNCDEVRLTAFKDGETKIYKKENRERGMKYPPIVFNDVYNFMQIKPKTRRNEFDEVFLKAEGYIDGKLATSDTVFPAYRYEKIKLSLDNEGIDLIADGSDIVTVVATITDAKGTTKHLNNSVITFEIEGNGEIIGNTPKISNPKQITWGSAPILIKATPNPGTITIKASMLFPGINRPLEQTISFDSKPATIKMLYDKKILETHTSPSTKQKLISEETVEKKSLLRQIQLLEKELNTLKLNETKNQQEEFGEKEKKN